ncbi:hypothetical protein [Kitasatospora sp. NPDC057541]|uniref:hypothetical protein n=1 Tax=unclassified Kitasatospora TaxID=2633591 RepID=UPI0036A643E2
MNAGTGLDADGGSATVPWPYPMTWPGNGEAGDIITRRHKGKASYLRRSFTEAQLATIHRHLTNETGNAACGMLLVGYGGRVKARWDPRDAFRHALSVTLPE